LIGKKLLSCIQRRLIVLIKNNMKKTITIIVVILAVWFGYMTVRGLSNDSDDAILPNSERMNNQMSDDADVIGDMAQEQNSMPEFQVDAPEDQQKNFDVIGTNFNFSLKEIRVKKGDTVRVNLLSNEGFHDWVVDEFDASTERVGQAQTSSVIFVADKAGEFEYYCSVGNHRMLGMIGKLVVEE